MLKIEGLSKAYGGQNLFQNISFQLTKGERCSLIGRNGSGKSTLLRILIGQETQDAGNVIAPKNYLIGYLEQHISFTQATAIEETALALSEDEKLTPYRAKAILSGLGFSEEDFEKDPKSFSGGYQLRIQLAKTLLKEPDCLLLDEPTNYLDVVSIRWLEGFLRNWKGEMILISHDKLFLDSVSTHTMGLHRNKLYRVEGGCRPFYDYILQVEEVHEKTRQKIDKQKEHAEDFIRRFGAKAAKAKQAQSRKKAIDRLPSLEKLAHLGGLDFRFNYLNFPGKRLLQVNDLGFQYPETQDPLINQLSLEVEPGDRIAIIGKNGRGKSTLLKLLAGDLTPQQGTMVYAENLAIGFFGQTNIQKLNLSLSIEEEIHQANLKLSFTEVRKICGMMMFSGKDAEKKIRVLSGGEKSRVLLGKILASPCNLLLLDEPSNHLDIESVEALLEALEDFPGSVIVVSHDEEILDRIPDKLIICRQSEQEIFQGNYAYFLEKVGWESEIEKKRKPSKDQRKENKKKRADLIQERSRTLAPIKKQIDKIELIIQEAEKELSGLQKELDNAILQKNNSTISQITKKIGEVQKKCATCYSELEIFYTNYEKESSRFDVALEE